jgi:hypothetical protein
MGPLDKVTSKFEEYVLQLDLKGYAIWHYDKIRTFLDNYEDVRRAYAAWITPGDVLSEALRALGAGTSDAESVISSYIQEELLADQYANLEQAGHAADERVPLAPVFVDLPISSRSVSSRKNTFPRDKSDMPRFVQFIVRLSQERFNSQGYQSEAREGQHASNRVVLLGGPGQGKTTLAQFICQLFRTALLRQRPQYTLISEAQDIIKAIDKQCNSDQILQPPCRRFPVRIPLNHFARALASNEDHQATSVFSYIRHHIAKRTDRSVSDHTLRRWLEATARLMTTPLQVTIMATLVDRRGTPPHERWKLFKEYYEVIYLRELERQIPAAVILNQYRADIDEIHADTAFMLQVASEHTGTTDARLSQTGFEIRSLQEFMAAEGLMDGSDRHVELRLRQLAPVSHWRNVFLFQPHRHLAMSTSSGSTRRAVGYCLGRKILAGNSFRSHRRDSCFPVHP